MALRLGGYKYYNYVFSFYIFLDYVASLFPFQYFMNHFDRCFEEAGLLMILAVYLFILVREASV